MGTIVEKEVTMTADDWRALYDECLKRAVQFAQPSGVSHETGERIINAADYLRAAKEFAGHANLLELSDETNTATVEVWDLSDEED